MSERNIRLTVAEDDDPFTHKQRFIISVGDSGVEIRREGGPVADRDGSVACTVGREPEYTTLVLHVEEAP
jgi:hypothetical protein